MTTSASIVSAKDFANDPVGWQQRWTRELGAARKASKKWKANGKRITKVFLDEREDDMRGDTSRLNVFSANIITMRAMMFGQIPRVDVGRRYNDADDDPARVAAEILERCLNADIGKQFSYSLGMALDDRLLVGCGLARVAYEAEFETIQHPAITIPDGVIDPETGEQGERVLAEAYEEEKKTFEAAPVYFINWRDVEWSPARTWDEVRWIAFKNYLTRDQCVKRFGEKIGNAMPLGQAKKSQAKTGIEDDPWQKAEVWEIWDKESEQVWWVVEGMDVICDVKDDLLGLVGFFPCPQFLMANVTSEKYAPRADYLLAQDQYEELNTLTTRITMLARAIKVVGVYNKESDGVQRMLNEGVDNVLIPVDNWAMFAEKGGIKGQVDWLPLEQVAAALAQLRDHRTELMNLLFQVTGMSDIMRGSTVQGETATAQSIKAKFASVRVQTQQDQFATFATDLMRLRAEVICGHFDDASILKESNMELTPDKEHIPAAMQMLRDLNFFKLEIKSETLALQDMAALRGEKAEFITGLSTFLAAAKPLVEQYPSAAPVLLEMLKWSMTGFKGSSTIEGVLDRAIAQLQQEGPAPNKPDPAVAKQKQLAEAQKMKLQGDQQREQFKAQGKQQEIGANLQADLTRIQAETGAEIKKQAAQFAFDTREQQRADSVRQAEILANPTQRPQSPPPRGARR